MTPTEIAQPNQPQPATQSKPYIHKPYKPGPLKCKREGCRKRQFPPSEYCSYSCIKIEETQNRALKIMQRKWDREQEMEYGGPTKRHKEEPSGGTTSGQEGGDGGIAVLESWDEERKAMRRQAEEKWALRIREEKIRLEDSEKRGESPEEDPAIEPLHELSETEKKELAETHVRYKQIRKSFEIEREERKKTRDEAVERWRRLAEAVDSPPPQAEGPVDTGSLCKRSGCWERRSTNPKYEKFCSFLCCWAVKSMRHPRRDSPVPIPKPPSPKPQAKPAPPPAMPVTPVSYGYPYAPYPPPMYAPPYPYPPPMYAPPYPYFPPPPPPAYYQPPAYPRPQPPIVSPERSVSGTMPAQNERETKAGISQTQESSAPAPAAAAATASPPPQPPTADAASLPDKILATQGSEDERNLTEETFAEDQQQIEDLFSEMEDFIEV